ncbi:Ig-like domain-containing protein [Castellaniella sp.]|uniref:Ig-like domain-containing protein n=1 Tax=Castellaniella sp. TaxID=1955812 RepID=UPI002AFDE56D|nr:Ig-like domain-containing protein [Castellaniella sp.]
MSRYRRVNIDGKSITETRKTGLAIKPGVFAIISGDEFIKAPSGSLGRVYIVNPAYHQGQTIDDEIASGDSAVADYVESGREFACRVAAGSYSKDQPMTIGSGGVAEGGNTNIIGFCQDDVTLAAEGFVRVRITAAPASATVTGVTIDTPDSTSVSNGATLALTATVAPAAADQRVTWTSATTGVFTIDATTGVATAVAGSGTSVITATSVADGAKTDTVTLTATA